MKNVIRLQFPAPKVMGMVVNRQSKQIALQMDWGSAGLADVVIKKVKGGFTYEDKQMGLTRQFIGKDGLEFLMWEFELPVVLKNILKSL